MRVLVVEDDPRIASDVARTLSACPLTVSVVPLPPSRGAKDQRSLIDWGHGAVACYSC